jgi:hypothetical protein
MVLAAAAAVMVLVQVAKVEVGAAAHRFPLWAW